MDIGFIGLGIMGKPMAVNLLQAGYTLRVRDINGKAEEELKEKGAFICRDMKELTEKSSIIILMLPDSPDVEQVIAGTDGILPWLKQGTIVIDMSSINPNMSRKLEKKVREMGCHMLDAPVSGGQSKAIGGSLAIMCGGREDVFMRVLPIFKAMGKTVTLVGEIGSGNTCKLANQMIVAANIAALSEALAFAARAGVDPERVFCAIRGGLAGGQVMEDKTPMMLSGEFDPGFRMRLHAKDLTNALAVANEAEIELIFTGLALKIMKKLCDEGMENLDHAAIVRYYEEAFGVSVAKEKK